MKKILIVSILLFSIIITRAQEFNKQLATARTSYSSGKLDDARFAMEQMLQEIDIVVGKEVLKILPAKMENKVSESAKDEVSGSSGYYGVTIKRDYGTEDNNISLEILTNSPMIAGINALLSVPLLAGTGDNKVIRINGYKALVQKNSGNSDKPEYEVQLPLNATLITLRAPGYTFDQVVKMANTIPVSQIAKMIQ